MVPQGSVKHSLKTTAAQVLYPPQTKRESFSSLMQIYNKTVMLNGLRHFSGYERRMTRCIEVLPTAPHSAMGTSAVVKPWKEKLQKSIYFVVNLFFKIPISDSLEKSLLYISKTLLF
ncbi:hypothetical protein TNCV_239511 [Trichonephila clavipes]|nr:hypothetical protein TNCV_239511 [Trichonephila clavipes]